MIFFFCFCNYEFHKINHFEIRTPYACRVRGVRCKVLQRSGRASSSASELGEQRDVAGCRGSAVIIPQHGERSKRSYGLEVVVVSVVVWLLFTTPKARITFNSVGIYGCCSIVVRLRICVRSGGVCGAPPPPRACQRAPGTARLRRVRRAARRRAPRRDRAHVHLLPLLTINRCLTARLQR